MVFKTAALLLLLVQPAQAGQKLLGSGKGIPRNAVTGGGLLASAAGFGALNNGVAEPSVSTFSGGGFQFYAGLMHLAAQPGSVVSIVAVSKATGTLELSWQAPGLDGFVGDLSGFYRLDYSSDAAHPFDPTAYQVEFATSVVAGSTQAYLLSGLQPNTTYYTRVYLADARKVVAETSARSDESTLARVPVSPVISGVGASSVTFTWNVPADGTAGYRLDASSTNFGALFPGGSVVSSRTGNGLQITITVVGLAPATTYFFKLGSLNWQDDINFNTVLSTVTLPYLVPPIENLALAPDALHRRVLLTWDNPPFANRAGVLVQVSTNPISSTAQDGAAYPAGSVLADGSVVKSSAAAASHLEADLELDATRYFRLYTADTAHVYSVFVSTFVVLDLPPMAPAGLQADLNPSRSSITLTWAGVTSNLDGSGFKTPGSPMPWEFRRYDVYRATGIARANWVWIGSAPAAASSYTASIPDPDSTFFYKVVSMDDFSAQTDAAMVMDTDKNLYAVAPDQVSRLKVDRSIARTLLAGWNSYGKPILLRAEDRPQDLGGKVVKSVGFAPVQSPSNAAAESLQFPAPNVGVTLAYAVAGGQVVASSFNPQGAPSSLQPAVNASDAAGSLGAYWFNGKDYVKLYGQVDPASQTVSLQSAMPGNYQIRSLARTAGFNFDVSGVSNKAITPNGDGLNDTVVFTFDNPRDSAFSGKIFDLRGALVSEMRPGPVADSLLWDGKANGRAVPGGVYIYQIQGEDRTFNGTVLVIR